MRVSNVLQKIVLAIPHDGTCRKHYKEYLVFKINQSHIDPLPLYNKAGQLIAILRREELNIPYQSFGEGHDQYAERLRQVWL